MRQQGHALRINLPYIWGRSRKVYLETGSWDGLQAVPPLLQQIKRGKVLPPAKFTTLKRTESTASRPFFVASYRIAKAVEKI
jgi:hypothetical protein